MTMHICVVGAGAIGGMLAVRLSQAGFRITVIDRGAHLQAIRTRGLKLITAEGNELVAHDLIAHSRATDCEPADLVFLAVKAHEIAALASDLPHLFGTETPIITVQNGLPWWYFQRHGGRYDGVQLASLDATGHIARHIPSHRIIGCVAYPAAQVVAPGVIRHIEGMRLPLGELDGTKSARATRIAEALTSAGFKTRVIVDIRAELWLKAWGALSFNPISALTGATMAEICRFAPTRSLVDSMMREAQQIAHCLGIEFRHTVEKRIAGAEAVGAHKTSMLQDAQAGRPLEVHALVGSIAELGQLVGVPCPAITAVLACTELLNESLTRNSKTETHPQDGTPVHATPSLIAIP